LRKNGLPVYAVVALGAMGIGAIVEISEFFVALNVIEDHVGGFVNVSLDLIFNTLGAVLGVVALWRINAGQHARAASRKR